MIIFKKATLEDIKTVVTAIMNLKNTNSCITDAEAYEFIDHCYYAYDQDLNSVVGIVAATREILTETSELNGETVETHPHRYKIVYMLGDDYAIEEYSSPQNLQSVMVYLVRELTADMNDWSVWVDTNDIFVSDDFYNVSLYRALRSNYFRPHKTEPNLMIRTMPVNFDRLH